MTNLDPALRKQVATEIMESDDPSFAYEALPQHAWQVVERMVEIGFRVSITWGPDGAVCVDFHHTAIWRGGGVHEKIPVATAICKAALKAVRDFKHD